MTEIEFSEIVEMLSYNGMEMSEDQGLRMAFFNERVKFYSERPDPKNPEKYLDGYDLDSHIRWIEETAEKYGVSDNISFEDNPKDFPIKNDRRKFLATFVQKKIIIKNLKIVCSHGEDVIFHLEELHDFDWGIEERKIVLEFKSCIFEGNNDSHNYIQFLVKHENALIFIDNDFKKVDLYLGFPSEHESDLVLEGNKFNNSHVSIGANEEIAYNQVFSSNKPEISRNISKKKNENNSQANVVLSRNDFNTLILGSPVNYRLDSGNNINRFILYNFSKIYFSPRQKIGRDGLYTMEHRRIFGLLGKYASDKSDLYQERIFKREILKCENQLLEKQRWRDTWQDKLVLIWGRFISNHGISWISPILFLSVVNFFVAVYLNQMTIRSDSIGVWEAFWSLFYPIFNFLPKLHGGDWVNSIAAFVFIVQKIILAACIYEFLKSVRRFS